MKYDVSTALNFERQFEALAIKYPSLANDVAELIDSLEENPTQGDSLGGGIYKIRLNIKSKSAGKRGGGRVITCVKVVARKVYLTAIYDKSEIETLTKWEIEKILKEIPKQ